MPHADEDIDRRLTDLEVKACYQDDLLETLNRLVAEQSAQITQLRMALARLAEQQSDARPEGFRSLRDELPPHY
ncbi:MAG: hypothetical protein RLY78_4050 [Pseudomonadota bacterium]|jgi:SlyX protein|uniref:SlyX family protein n=1 Tax=Pseudaquabacterium rugosum TaxID=2984194 RepID=A0ABU9BC58_9BURK